ncbi:MAG: DUF3380 domain-containing protein [Anaerolineae bacterium]|nr:DUF3380 domain-containing protein [Anaerolineae bacterium]
MSTVVVRVESPELGYLNVRDAPEGNLVTQVSHGSTLLVLEPEATARAKIGQQGQWLQVRLPDGRPVYLAAWYVVLHTSLGGASSLGPISDRVSSATGLRLWVYSPEVGFLNIRNAPSTSGSLVTQAQHNEALTALEPEATARAKVGQQGEWLNIQLESGQKGYAAASYLSPISPRPVDASLEPAESDKITITPNLAGTERQVAMIWNRLGGQLQELSDQLGIDPAVAVAVWTVESGGRAFGPDGRMVIRFENHIFYNQWGKHDPGRFAKHFTYNADRSWTGHQWRPSTGDAWRTFHGDQNGEWEVLNFACSLNDTAGKNSISMGGPQIMGFNSAALGYNSVQEMFKAFAESEGDQVIGFFNFVRSRGAGTVQKLQASDFTGFARVYNGSGQAETYGNLIRQAYEAYHKLTSVSFALTEVAGEAAVMVEVDNLKRILGIGKKTAERLAAEGIDTFSELAVMDEERLRDVLGASANRLRWIGTWPAQARLAAWGDWEALEDFQARIK